MAANVSVGTIPSEVSLTQLLKQATKLAIAYVKDSVKRIRNQNQPAPNTPSGGKKAYEAPQLRKITAEQARLLVLGHELLCHGSAEELHGEFVDVLFRPARPPDLGSHSDAEMQGNGDTPAEDSADRVRNRAV